MIKIKLTNWNKGRNEPTFRPLLLNAQHFNQIGVQFVEDGSYVNEGDLLCEIESDKATLEMPSENSGVIKIMAEEGSELEIGVKIGEIDIHAKPVDKPKEESKKESEDSESFSGPRAEESSPKDKPYPSPAASKIMREKGLDPSEVNGSGKDGRITKGDALSTPASSKEAQKEDKLRLEELKKEEQKSAPAAE